MMKKYTGSKKNNEYLCLECGFTGSKMIVQNHVKIHRKNEGKSNDE